MEYKRRCRKAHIKRVIYSLTLEKRSLALDLKLPKEILERVSEVLHKHLRLEKGNTGNIKVKVVPEVLSGEICMIQYCEGMWFSI